MKLTRKEKKIIKEAFKLWSLERDLTLFPAKNGEVSEDERKRIREKLEAMANKRGFSLIELEKQMEQFKKMLREL